MCAVMSVNVHSVKGFVSGCYSLRIEASTIALALSYTFQRHKNLRLAFLLAGHVVLWRVLFYTLVMLMYWTDKESYWKKIHHNYKVLLRFLCKVWFTLLVVWIVLKIVFTSLVIIARAAYWSIKIAWRILDTLVNTLVFVWESVEGVRAESSSKCGSILHYRV